MAEAQLLYKCFYFWSLCLTDWRVQGSIQSGLIRPTHRLGRIIVGTAAFQEKVDTGDMTNILPQCFQHYSLTILIIFVSSSSQHPM
jgi:hypothetical protein